MIWDWVNLYHMYLFRLISASQSFVLFYLWYSSCFEVKCWIHTFPKCCSHIAMWILILLIIEVVMSILSNRCDSLQDDPIIFPIRKINSKSSQRYLFHPSPSFLCFPALPPFFFKGPDFLIKYPFIHVRSLHSFQSMFLLGDYHEVGQEFQVRHSLLFSSPVVLIQAFGVDHIPFLVSNVFPHRCTS